MVQAQIIADSLDPKGNRLTTFILTFPRIILAEFNTHRVFSRNSASSRAIPFEKMVKAVQENPFIPLAWQKDHKGMQGTNYFTKQEDIDWNISKWLTSRDNAINSAKYLNAGFSDDKKGIGVTKQLCNRLLEPFMWHTVIMTSGKEGLENFFKQRCPQYNTVHGTFRSKKDAFKYLIDNEFEHSYSGAKAMSDLEWLNINISQAEIHIQALAESMWDAYNESTPNQLRSDEWHIPFGDNLISNGNDELYRFYGNHPNKDNLSVKIATARCARVSYTVVGDTKEHSYEKDLELHDRLKELGHFSPFEHCAKVMTDEEYCGFIKGNFNQELEVDSDGFINISTHINNSRSFGWCNNFKGFIPYRYQIENN